MSGTPHERPRTITFNDDDDDDLNDKDINDEKDD